VSGEEGIRTLGACGSCLFVVTVCNELARVRKQNCVSCFEFFFFSFSLFSSGFCCEVCLQAFAYSGFWFWSVLPSYCCGFEVLSLGFEGKLGCGANELGFVSCNVSREFFFPLV